MNDEIFNDITLERISHDRFGVKIDIAEVIVRSMPVSVVSRATLFKTTNGHVLLFVQSQSAQLLDDVRKIVQRMQCEADYFYPPHGDTEYFDRQARAKHQMMFPGKHITSEEDLRYYKNLTPYNPALVRIAKIKGEIRGYDIETKSWRKVRDYAYTKMKVA